MYDIKSNYKNMYAQDLYNEIEKATKYYSNMEINLLYDKQFDNNYKLSNKFFYNYKILFKSFQNLLLILEIEQNCKPNNHFANEINHTYLSYNPEETLNKIYNEDKKKYDKLKGSRKNPFFIAKLNLKKIRNFYKKLLDKNNANL
jgi:hypothetical protein